MKVEISFDGGSTWNEAHDYIKEKRDPGKKVFSWTLWKYYLDINEQVRPDNKPVRVIVRATGSDGEV